MANRAKMTEHAGAKKSKGAYAGRKNDAKRESNKLRRLQSRQMAEAVIGKANDKAISSSLEGEGPIDP